MIKLYTSQKLKYLSSAIKKIKCRSAFNKIDRENTLYNQKNHHSNSFWKQLSTNSELWVTNYSKRVKSKYLLNYYSKVSKEKRQSSKSHISENVYSFVHRAGIEFKPKVSYKWLVNEPQNEMNADLLHHKSVFYR